MTTTPQPPDPQAPKINSSVSHSARIWNDQEVGEQILAFVPELVRSARADRYFLARAVRYLAAQGIRQFLDIGTGLPTVDNTHEVAQRAVPESKVVYVDNDRCKSGCAHGSGSARGGRATGYRQTKPPRERGCGHGRY